MHNTWYFEHILLLILVHFTLRLSLECRIFYFFVSEVLLFLLKLNTSSLTVSKPHVQLEIRLNALEFYSVKMRSLHCVNVSGLHVSSGLSSLSTQMENRPESPIFLFDFYKRQQSLKSSRTWQVPDRPPCLSPESRAGTGRVFLWQTGGMLQPNTHDRVSNEEPQVSPPPCLIDCRREV